VSIGSSVVGSSIEIPRDRSAKLVVLLTRVMLRRALPKNKAPPVPWRGPSSLAMAG
jgi:hypothetical protein